MFRLKGVKGTVKVQVPAVTSLISAWPGYGDECTDSVRMN